MITKTAVAMVMSLAFGNVYAGCLDGKTSTIVISSKIHGFYINSTRAADAASQYVILDKANCTAWNSDRVELAPYTARDYYLKFDSEDKTLYSALLSAEARGITVDFRIMPDEGGQYNAIAYIVTPTGANSQN